MGSFFKRDENERGIIMPHSIRRFFFKRIQPLRKTKNPTNCRVFAAEAEGVEPPVRSHGRLFSRQLR